MIIINAKIFSMEQPPIEDGFVTFENGKISAIGPMAACGEREDAETLDAEGGSLYPGFIDAHTHLGLWADGLGFEGEDGNEDTDPATPHLRALDGINPFDRCFDEAVAAGITSVVTGPGSSNPIGGQMIALKTHGRILEQRILREPCAMKFALGENPKVTYHQKSVAPVTRMATAAIIREQLYKAQRYYRDKILSRDEGKEEPDYDMKCEALLPLLQRKIPAHFHAHRADDIATAMRLAGEFELDYVIVHGTEGYLMADWMGENNVRVLAGPLLCDRSKPEIRNLTPTAPGILRQAGVSVALVTDHPVIPIQYLPLCAALAVREGMDREDALRAITIEAARICLIDHRVGSLAVGKDADMVLFTDDPLSALAQPQAVFIDGKRVK